MKILRAHELPVEHVNPRYPVIRSTIAPRTPGAGENAEPYGAIGTDREEGLTNIVDWLAIGTNDLFSMAAGVMVTLSKG